MVVAATPNDATTCGGTWSPPPVTDTMTFYRRHRPGRIDTCTVSVDVTAPTAGTYENTSAVLASSELPDADAAAASLVVTPLVVTKTFVEGSITSGGTATFNITIRNDGNEDLINIVADDPLAPECNRASGVLGTLAHGTPRPPTPAPSPTSPRASPTRSL